MFRARVAWRRNSTLSATQGESSWVSGAPFLCVLCASERPVPLGTKLVEQTEQSAPVRCPAPPSCRPAYTGARDPPWRPAKCALPHDQREVDQILRTHLEATQGARTHGI